MSKTLDDLRDHLFKTLEGLQDKTNPMDIDRAKAVSEVAQTIINTAKVEIDHMRVTGSAGGSKFIPDQGKTTATGRLESTVDEKGLKTTVHRMR